MVRKKSASRKPKRKAGARKAEAPAAKDPASESSVTETGDGDDDLLPILEAMLFAAHEPLSPQRLSRALGPVSTERVREALEVLAARLEERGSPAKLLEIAGGFRLMTRPEYAPYLGRLFHKAERDRLSPAALETLAIIAYKQPATRADVETIRGVQAGPALKTLQERRLVKTEGRAPIIGRPMQYGTTKKFLDIFGLASLEDLPQVLRRPVEPPRVQPRAGFASEEPDSAEELARVELPEEAGAGAGAEPETETETEPETDPETGAEPESESESGSDSDSDSDSETDPAPHGGGPGESGLGGGSGSSAGSRSVPVEGLRVRTATNVEILPRGPTPGEDLPGDTFLFEGHDDGG